MGETETGICSFEPRVLGVGREGAHMLGTAAAGGGGDGDRIDGSLSSGCWLAIGSCSFCISAACGAAILTGAGWRGPDREIEGRCEEEIEAR